VSWCHISPDGKWIAAEHFDGKDYRLYPVDGGEPLPIPGLLPGEKLDWTPDPKFMYVNQSRQIPIKIYRLNIVTGQRQLFKEVSPLDVTGLCGMFNIKLSADGRGYIYGYTRMLSDLYLVKGLQ
jgi:hypothetical protein